MDEISRTVRPKRRSGAAAKSPERPVIVKRSGVRRHLGLFVDGPALDRAARRLERKIDYAALLGGLSAGTAPVVARYYTVIPYEDDSRHRAFLDAIRAAGFRVIVKRLPPKGITRQVTVDVEMAADVIAFGLGVDRFGDLSDYHGDDDGAGTDDGASAGDGAPGRPYHTGDHTGGDVPTETRRVVTVVCPSRELAYPLSVVKGIGVDTVSADFSEFGGGDVLKSAAKWIDLSDSDMIWRNEKRRHDEAG